MVEKRLHHVYRVRIIAVVVVVLFHARLPFSSGLFLAFAAWRSTPHVYGVTPWPLDRWTSGLSDVRLALAATLAGPGWTERSSCRPC